MIQTKTEKTKGREFFRELTAMLRGAGLESPALEASLILDEVAGTCGHRAQDAQLSPPQKTRAAALVEVRAGGVPLAYVLGRREFMSIDIRVDERVLIPRPETETLVETAERWAARRGGGVTFLDIGTGSGNIAISLLARDSVSRVVGVDISEEALQVAKLNARDHGVGDRFCVVCGDVTQPLRNSFKADIVVSNPPYISDEEFDELPREVGEHEPKIALRGGRDGLDFYRRLAKSIPNHLASDGVVAVEVGFHQADAVGWILSESALEIVEVVKDLAGIDRVIVGRNA
ncbi:peptide chain release factor N(5)-glutamine methyltransferase [Planctomycetota bacterium]